MLKIRPLGTRVLLAPDGVPKKIGSLYIPPTSKEMESCEGIVIAIGEEVERVKVGEKVAWGRYAGINYSKNEESYYLLNEGDIIAVLEEGGE